MQRVSFIPHHYLKIIIIYIFQLRKPRLRELPQLVQTTWLINGKFGLEPRSLESKPRPLQEDNVGKAEKYAEYGSLGMGFWKEYR